MPAAENDSPGHSSRYRPLIRFFLHHLHLYRNAPYAHNGSLPTRPWSPAGIVLPPLLFGGLMAKMAFFLLGFLALTVGIGLLATISPI
ncbi:hypothetical protein FQ186_23220 [Pseudomonas sp. ANT_H14]|nr:hypothetical protein FQ182_25590 [Pseudomonas sp. ANT_H4]KAA0949306.1 hypothetical protein FQ186_23220 [Pseudomonas sp. ANT_H14]